MVKYRSIGALFNIDRSGIVRHINNILKMKSCMKITRVQKLHKFKWKELVKLKGFIHITILM